MCKHKKHFSKDHNIYWCPECITFHAPRNYKWLKRIFGILIIIGISFSCIEAKCPSPIKELIIYNPLINKDISLTDSCIFNELIKEGSYFPEIGLRQAHQEAGNKLNSQIAKENKNIFGLRCNCTYTSGYKNSHSTYKSYKDCIKCYVKFTNGYWDKYCQNYAENKNYLLVLKQIK